MKDIPFGEGFKKWVLVLEAFGAVQQQVNSRVQPYLGLLRFPDSHSQFFFLFEQILRKFFICNCFFTLWEWMQCL